MHGQRFQHLITAMRTVVLIGTLVLLASCVGPAEWGQGNQTTIRPETDSTRVVQSIYALVTWIDVGIFIIVFGLLAFAVFRYRVRPGQTAEIPKQVHGNAIMELVWTIIPAIILIFIAVPTWSGIFRAARPPAEGAFAVQAVGHQWWWEFRYAEQGVVTANELVIPLGRPVVIDTSSVDVIHSFWVPKLSGKIDSLPNHVNTLWFTPEKTGLYYGQCAEFCGTSHANMRFRVRVVTPEEFQAWLAKSKQPPAPQNADAEAGAQLFVMKTCIACHTISGNPMAAGVLGPNLTNLPARTSLASGIMENTPENLVLWIRQTQTVKPGALMGTPDPDHPGRYKPVDMTDQEAAQIAAYLLSPPGEAMAPPAAASASMAPAVAGGKTAEQLFLEKACIGCHVIPGVPTAVGTVGPALAGLMSRPTMAGGKLQTSEDGLRTWLTNPKAVKPDTLMVTPPLSAGEIDTLVEFLIKLK